MWVIVVIIQWLSIATMVMQLLRIRTVTRERDQARAVATGAILFANAMADRGITLRCDDCGNVMGPDDKIDIIPRPNGEMYVGHSSHDRKSDWGLVE